MEIEMKEYAISAGSILIVILTTTYLAVVFRWPSAGNLLELLDMMFSWEVLGTALVAPSVPEFRRLIRSKRGIPLDQQ